MGYLPPLEPPRIRILCDPEAPKETWDPMADLSSRHVHVFSRTMSSLVDSAAEFKTRAKQLLGNDCADKLLAADVQTFGSLAYVVADQPDRISDARFEELLKKVYPADVSLKRSEKGTLTQKRLLADLNPELRTVIRGNPESETVYQAVFGYLRRLEPEGQALNPTCSI